MQYSVGLCFHLTWSHMPQRTELQGWLQSMFNARHASNAHQGQGRMTTPCSCFHVDTTLNKKGCCCTQHCVDANLVRDANACHEQALTLKAELSHFWADGDRKHQQLLLGHTQQTMLALLDILMHNILPAALLGLETCITCITLS